MIDTAIIIPTYNSRITIVELVKSILKIVKNGKVFVIDDNSPDKTADEVRKYFGKEKRVAIIVRKGKGGRGSAVLAGFTEALKSKDFKYFAEMDSDLCHDPKFIPDLVNKCRDNDVVVASRYLKRSVNINWRLKRKLFSKFVSSYLKIILGIPITDYSNGFRCYSRRALESIDFNRIEAKGFFVLTEIAYLLRNRGAKFAEVPITFKIHEKVNDSNLNLNEIKESFFAAIRLYNSNFGQRENKLPSLG